MSGKVKEIKTVSGSMYTDYLTMTNYVEKIYFAPKVSGMDLFRDILKQNGLAEIKCFQCDHPFAG